jgi:zinc protease
MAHRALAAAALLAALALPAQAAPKTGRTKAFPFPTQVVTLPNGLRVVLVPYDSPGLVAYYTLVRVGSRNEPEPGKSGFAHFFEHMMFRGTKAHPADEFAKTVTQLGLDWNAFTSLDRTIYFLAGPAKALPTIIDLEADRFQNLEYTEAQFRTEAGAILGEYAKNASIPELKLEERLVETAFTKHTYRHTTIGYLDDIKAMPEAFDYAQQFFKRYYRPDNTVVIVAGEFNKANTLALIKQSYGKWKGKTKAAPIPVEPKQREARTAAIEWPTPTLALLAMAWHTPGGADLKASATGAVLSAYLFGPTSPLYQDLVIERQIVDAIYGLEGGERDPNLFSIVARVKDPARLGDVESAVAAQLQELAAGKVDAKRMNAVRSNLKYSNILSLDTPRALAVRLAIVTAVTGDVQYLNKLYAQIDALAPRDLAAFAKKFLVDTNKTTVKLTPPAAGGATAGGAR